MSNMRFVRRYIGQHRQMRRTQRQLANFGSFELSDRVTQARVQIPHPGAERMIIGTHELAFCLVRNAPSASLSKTTARELCIAIVRISVSLALFLACSSGDSSLIGFRFAPALAPAELGAGGCRGPKIGGAAGN